MTTITDIDMTIKLLINGGYVKDEDAQDFRNWLAHMSGSFLEAERKASLAKERYYARSVMCEPYSGQIPMLGRRVETLLQRIAYSAKRGNAQGTWKQVALLLGDYWEDRFCSIVSVIRDQKIFSHRFLKDHLIGAATMGWGEDRVIERRGIPNILLEADGAWAFIDLRHTTYSIGTPTIPFGFYYCLKPGDYQRLSDMAQFRPSIPTMLAIHDYKRLGKWSLENRLEDWRAEELTKLGKPIWIQSARTPSRFKKEEQMMNAFFGKDSFRPLVKVIAELGHSGSTRRGRKDDQPGLTG